MVIVPHFSANLPLVISVPLLKHNASVPEQHQVPYFPQTLNTLSQPCTSLLPNMHLCTKVKHGFWYPTDLQEPHKWPQQGTVRAQVTTWQWGSTIQLLRAELLWGQHVSCDVDSFYFGSSRSSRLILRFCYTGQYTDTTTKVFSRLSAKAQSDQLQLASHQTPSDPLQLFAGNARLQCGHTFLPQQTKQRKVHPSVFSGNISRTTLHHSPHLTLPQSSQQLHAVMQLRLLFILPHTSAPQVCSPVTRQCKDTNRLSFP